MPAGESKRIKPPQFIALAGLQDLARLVCALERVPLPVFAISAPGGRRLAAQLDIFMGSPVFYYAPVDESKRFLSYRNTGGVEEVSLAEAAGNPTFAYAPIVNVARLPGVLARGLEMGSARRGNQFLSVEVQDLGSLARVASYKMAFEEPPLPLFAFTHGARHIMGTFTRIDDVEEASLFFYAVLPEPQKEGFLRYSPTRTQDTEFTNRLDEHGSLYVKIVRLAEPHPLVQLPVPA